MNDRARQRVFVLRVLVVSLVATLLGRLWYVQVLSGPTYRAQATANEQRQLVTPAPRGMIVDDEGRVLADDSYEYVVTVNEDTLSARKDGGLSVLQRLAPIVGESLADLQVKTRLCGDKNEKGQVYRSPDCYTGSPYEPIPVKAFAPADQAALTKALVVVERSELFPGVAISEQQVRQYPYGSVAGQELGYLERISAQQLTEKQYKGYQATDLVGQTGLEAEYDKQLRGTDSVKTVSIDATGKVIGTVSQTQPVPGETLVTNIDAGLQQAVEKELANGIQIAHSKGGLGTTAAAVVLNVHSGAVLAMASLPDYDPNEFTGGISTANYAALSDPDASTPLLSRAYQAANPPGSTFKISSASTILQNNLATPTSISTCGSTYTAGNQAFHNFEGEALGDIDLLTAIQHSCDTFFYKFAYDAWVHDGGPRLTTLQLAKPDQELFVKMAKAYGYGQDTGIDLPDESAGILDDRAETKAAAIYAHQQACEGAHLHPTDPAREAADARTCASSLQDAEALQAGDALDFAIGQGGQVNVTVLQQAVAYAAVANGGTRVVPEVAKAFISSTGTVTTVKPRSAGRVPVSAANLAALRQGFTEVVQVPGGTGTGAGFPAQLDVAGKTGTADVAATGPLANQPESWFISMEPVSNPQCVVAVLVEHGGQGAYAAGETNANILKDMYGLGGHTAVFPGGKVPTTLPKISATGAVTPPQRGIIGVVKEPGLPGGTPVTVSSDGTVTIGREDD